MTGTPETRWGHRVADGFVNHPLLVHLVMLLCSHFVLLTRLAARSVEHDIFDIVWLYHHIYIRTQHNTASNHIYVLTHLGFITDIPLQVRL